MIKLPLLLAAILLASSATLVHAQDPPQPPVPMTYFPQAADLTYVALLANGSLDCSWGFDCSTGQALFHTRTQSDLGRVWGWGELLNWVTQSDDVNWIFYVSYYQATDGATAASGDFVSALRQAKAKTTQAPQLAAPDRTQSLRTSSMELYSLTFAVGSVEFEGATIYPLRSPADKKAGRTGLVRAARYLAKQLVADQPAAHTAPAAMRGF
jgi:hypothetical protein